MKKVQSSSKRLKLCIKKEAMKMDIDEDGENFTRENFPETEFSGF